MKLREELIRVFGSCEASIPTYELVTSSWSRDVRLNKAGRIICNAESMFEQSVRGAIAEKLNPEKTKHILSLRESDAICGAVDTCNDICRDFLISYLKNKAPRQNKLFKFYNSIHISTICGEVKFEDMYFGFAKYINENQFEGKSDPKAVAIIAALQIMKDKLMKELDIKEPEPRRRRY